MREPIILLKTPSIEAMKKSAKQYADLDPLFIETFLALVHTSSELLNNAVDYFGRYGISPGRFGLLMQLKIYSDESPLSPSALAERCGVTRATVTGLLDGLERDDFVERSPDPNDRRAQIVHLTKAGNKFLDGFLPGHFQRIQGLMKGISDKDKKQLLATLTKILMNLNEFRQNQQAE
ncbi:MarR family transcriptional regulator [bacterium]|nr:MarR family transcriptional regulator [bacterium]